MTLYLPSLDYYFYVPAFVELANHKSYIISLQCIHCPVQYKSPAKLFFPFILIVLNRNKNAGVDKRLYCFELLLQLEAPKQTEIAGIHRYLSGVVNLVTHIVLLSLLAVAILHWHQLTVCICKTMLSQRMIIIPSSLASLYLCNGLSPFIVGRGEVERTNWK